VAVKDAGADLVVQDNAVLGTSAAKHVLMTIL